MRQASLLSLVTLAVLGGVASAQNAAGGRPAGQPGDLRASCMQREDIELKVRACERWLSTTQLTPAERAMGLIERGVGFRRKGDMDTAIRHYDEAIRLQPNLSLAYNNRGVAYEKKGEFDRAVLEYDHALRLNPRNKFAFANRGIIFKLRRNWARAAADFAAAIQNGANEPSLNFDRGVALLHLGRNVEAISDFNAALARMRPNAAHFLNRGMAFYNMRDLRRAAQDFAEATRLSPDSEIARRNLIAVNAELAQPAAATAVALKPLPRLASNGPFPTLPRPVAAQPVPAALPTPSFAPAAPAPAKSLVSLPVVAGETRVALVIGNASYSGVAQLKNPTNDAEAIAAKLRQIGFTKVSLVTNVSREAMIKALQEFSREAENADWAMVYFAGHGMQIGGTNWLLPTDASPKADRDLQFQAISVDQVTAAVDGARRLRLVVLDACRDNPFAAQMKSTNGATRSLARGLGRMEPSSTLVAFAAKDGETALDGEGRNSPFAEALIRHLGTPGLEVNRLFRRVASEVLKGTANRQEPLTYGRLPDEDLFFVAPQATSQVTPPAPRQPG